MFAPVTFDRLFTPDECLTLRSLAADSLARAALVGGVRASEIRSAEIAWLDHEGEAAPALERCLRAVADANRESFGFEIHEFQEPMQTARYAASESGHFDWHMDVGDGPIAARRKATIVVQLSDPGEYDGGKLEINGDGRSRAAPVEQGSAIVFPSFVLHRVERVSHGERWSLTLWAHGPTFR